MAEHMKSAMHGANNALFLAYATVPVQQLSMTYSLEDAMKQGTLFPEFDLPLGVYGKEGYQA